MIIPDKKPDAEEASGQLRIAVDRLQEFGRKFHASVTPKLLPIKDRRVPPSYDALVKFEIEALNSRSEICPEISKTEGHWKIAISLAFAEVENRKAQVKTIMLDTQMPSTTTLRYIELMESEGLVQRLSHENDARVVIVELTEKSRNALNRWVSHRTKMISQMSMIRLKNLRF